MPSEYGVRAAEAAYGDFLTAVPFDARFDLETADRVYCTELVWRAYREAEAALVAESKEISEKGGFARLDIVSEETVGTVSEVVVRVTYGNGEIEEEDYELTKIDGRWMLTPGMDK